MKLYKAYKQEKDLQEQEAADKEYLGEDNIVIVYEQSNEIDILKSILGVLGCIIVLALLAIGVVFLSLNI